jgi:predicted lipoprotein with Yx(FWY)xxD motif
MRRLVIAAPLLVAALVPLLAGAAPSGSRDAAPAAAPSATFTVGVIDTDTQGRVFTDPNFNVLYHDVRDNPAKGTFDCVAACLKTYRPLLTRPGATLLLPPGVAGTLASVVRPDGAGDQVTVNGSAVYTFTGDQGGDTSGLTATWHAVPSPVEPATPASPTN